MITSIIQHVLYGIVTGSILLLGTVGFTMVERLDGFVNIAHGQLIAIGAYIMWFCYSILGLNFIISAIFSIVAASMAALLTQQIFVKPILKFSTVTVIITSCGVGIFLNGLIEYFGGPDVHALDLPIYPIIRMV